MFQSTFPHGERPILTVASTQIELFQSTFPHGERLDPETGDEEGYFVSIHVPARGTTAIK